MGGKYNTLSRLFNLLIDHCNQRVRMVIVDDSNNNFDSNTLITASMEYNRIHLPEYTNILKSPQAGMTIGYHATNM
jgi:hypothetical protein